MQDKQKRRRLGDRVFRVPRLRPWSVALPTVSKPKTGAMSPLIIVYGFLGAIALGTLLLALPVSSKSGEFTSFPNALFSAQPQIGPGDYLRKSIVPTQSVVENLEINE